MSLAWAAWIQERKLQKQKGCLWRHVQGSAHDQLLLPLLPWLQVSWEPLEVRRKKAKRSIPQERRGSQAYSGESVHCIFHLKGFYLLSKGWSFMEALRGRSQQNIQLLSRCVFNMQMHQNEFMGEFGIIL